jgi:magnesium transporter
MVASFYGMNVSPGGMPFATHPHGFSIVLGFTLCLTLIVAWIFNKKDLF